MNTRTPLLLAGLLSLSLWTGCDSGPDPKPGDADRGETTAGDRSPETVEVEPEVFQEEQPDVVTPDTPLPASTGDDQVVKVLDQKGNEIDYSRPGWKDETEGREATLIYVARSKSGPTALVFSSDRTHYFFQRGNRPGSPVSVKRLTKEQMGALLDHLDLYGLADLPLASEPDGPDHPMGPERAFYLWEGEQPQTRRAVRKDTLPASERRRFAGLEKELMRVVFKARF